MATSGRTRGHQRAGFMAASGQKPLALDTPLWPTSVPHPVGEWCGTAPRPASGSPYDNDEDGPRELRRDEQIDGDEDCPHQDGDNRGGRSVRCALAACGTGLALCLLVVLKCDGHRRDQPPLWSICDCLSAFQTALLRWPGCGAHRLGGGRRTRVRWKMPRRIRQMETSFQRLQAVGTALGRCCSE